MIVLTVIGGVVVALLAAGALWLLWEIAGNIYGTAKGLHRLASYHHRYKIAPMPRWRQYIRPSLRGWLGDRSSFWQLGAIDMPVDGRDKIRRRRSWPA